MSNAATPYGLDALLQSEPPGYGFKVALNFPGPQRLLGLDGPVAAPIGTTQVVASGATWPRASERALHVEAELALTLGRDVDRPLSSEALRAAIAHVTPCLELVDYALPKGTVAAMLQHRFFHAGIVLGATHDAGALGPLTDDLPRVTSSDGLVRTRLAGTVPDDVVEALARLCAHVLAAGGQLAAGQAVLCGSYVEPLPLVPGATVRADFGAYGEVAITRAG